MRCCTLITALALFAGPVSAQAFQMQDANYNLVYGVEILGKTPPSMAYTTLYTPPVATLDGMSAVAQRTKRKGFAETAPIKNGTSTQSRIEVYGYRLVVTPDKLGQGQLEKSSTVHTQVQLEHSVPGQDGRAIKLNLTKAVDLKVGEQTTLDWSNNGSEYQMKVRLVSANSVHTAEQSQAPANAGKF